MGGYEEVGILSGVLVEDTVIVMEAIRGHVMRQSAQVFSVSCDAPIGVAAPPSHSTVDDRYIPLAG